MNTRNYRKIPVFFLLFLLIQPVIETRAYVPRASMILSEMVEALGSSPGIFVSQKVILLENGTRHGTFTETLLYQFPDRFRSELIMKDGRRIHVFSPEGSGTVIDRKSMIYSETWRDRFKDPLLFRNPEMIQKRLEAFGVDLENCTPGRFDGKTVFVIGAQYPDETRSQIWIDKKSRLPVRWICRPNAGKPEGLSLPSVEFRYMNWKKRRKVAYPDRVLFLENGKAVREILVTDVELNPSFSGNPFDIENLPREAVEYWNDSGTPDEWLEVKQATEDFARLFDFDFFSIDNQENQTKTTR